MIFRGNTRLFDKPEQELETSTGTIRLLTIDGINSYSDLSGKIVPVIAYSDGEANAVMNINNLGAKAIHFFKNNDLIEVNDYWITAGQLYFLYYDSTSDYFIIFNFNHNILAPTLDILKVNNSILNLTNTSTTENITAAFGTDADVQTFINAIQSGHLIVLYNEDNLYNYVPVNYFENQLDDTNVVDSISILDTTNQYIKTLKFSRNVIQTNFTAVTVTTTPISGGSGGVTEEQVQSMIDESVGTINTELDNINGEVV